MFQYILVPSSYTRLPIKCTHLHVYITCIIIIHTSSRSASCIIAMAFSCFSSIFFSPIFLYIISVLSMYFLPDLNIGLEKTAAVFKLLTRLSCITKNATKIKLTRVVPPHAVFGG